MIYLEKDGLQVSTNDKETAAMFENGGYARIKGRRYWGLVLGKGARKTALGLALPAAVGLAMFHFCDGRDPAAFVLGVYTFYVMQELFSDWARNA